MDELTPTGLLTGMKVLFGLVTATAAVISQTLIRAELIPEQITFVGSLGALLIIIALFVTIGWYKKLGRLFRIWIGTALVMLLVLVVLQVGYVITLENFGEPPATYKYLVGLTLTDEGNRVRNLLGPNKSESEFVAEMGVDRIPVAYGKSYFVVATTYSASYLLFVLAAVLAFGSVIIPLPNSAQKVERTP